VVNSFFDFLTCDETSLGATENAGVKNAIRSKMQSRKIQ